MAKILEDSSEYFYFVFRVFVGLLFAQHGAQKLFGMFTARPPVELFSLFGMAGVIELFGGLAIALGILTRLAALAGAAEMVAAYFKVHVPRGPVPNENQGELALLFLAAFLILIAHGSKIWGLEMLLFKKKTSYPEF
jgi:putative oxidoreductase